MTTLVWEGLQLWPNMADGFAFAAFITAVNSGFAVLPIYISAPHEDGQHGCPPNTAVAVWLQHALQALKVKTWTAGYGCSLDLNHS